MKKDDKDIKEFFEIIGEIWRDICLLEFLMKCAIARIDGDIEKFPLPPWKKGTVYTEYPSSFSLSSFSAVVKEFNERYPSDKIPEIVIEIRHAMAHG